MIGKTKTAMKPTVAKDRFSTLVASTPNIRSKAYTKRGSKPSSGSLGLSCAAQTSSGKYQRGSPLTYAFRKSGFWENNLYTKL